MKDRKQEIIGILLLILSLCIFTSLIGFDSSEDPQISPNVKLTNTMGIAGIYVSYFMIKLGFGVSIFVVPILGFAWGWYIFSRKKLAILFKPSQFILVGMLWLSISLGQIAIWVSQTHPNFQLISGFSGWAIANLFYDFFGGFGVSLILVGGWLLIIRGYFSWNFYRPFQIVGDWVKEKWNAFRLKRTLQKKADIKQKHTQELISKIEDKQKKVEDEIIEEKKEDDLELEEESDITKTEITSRPDDNPLEISPNEKPELTSDSEPSNQKIEVGEMVIEEEVSLDKLKERKSPKREYQLPTTDLLESPLNIQDGMNKEELLDRANFLTKSLATFGVEGKVVNVHPGPVITLFEVEPAEGVRVNKFVQLSDDLARVMEASRVRVIAPIPGKSSVGIEIPNRNPAMVYFKSIVNSEKFAGGKSLLTLAIGKNTSGEIETLNLGDMPHLLIAGTTGSGKSVCLNTIICSILYRAKPDDPISHY